MGSLIDIWKFSALSIPNNELCDASCEHIRLGTVKCSPPLCYNPHCAHGKLERLRNIPRVMERKVDFITICFKSSFFGNTVVDMNSQQLRLHAQDLNKTKPIKLLAWFGEEIMNFHWGDDVGSWWLLEKRGSVFRDIVPKTLPIFRRIFL